MPDRIITQTSHLAQLRKSPYAINQTDKAVSADIKTGLERTEHFLFTAVPDHDDDVAKSIAAMQEADVWRLPYPVCTFEYRAQLHVYDNAPLDRKVKHAIGGEAFDCISLCVERADGSPGIIATFIKIDPANKRSWTAIYHAATDGDPARDVDDIGGTTADPAGVDPAVFDAYRAGKRAGSMSVVGLESGTAASVGQIVSACLVALATRGIRRERWIGDKKVLLGRTEPENAYTRVMIAEAATGEGGHAMPGERHKVRLHMRAGHIRNQPHGPGRRYTRAIYIAPMLVGYEEEGTITHEHYEVYPHEEHA